MTYAGKNKLQGAAFIAAIMFSLQSGVAVAADTPSSVDEFSNSIVIGNAELDKNRGTGAPINYNISSLSANLNGNTDTGSISGNNSIESGALAGFNGFANLIQNSGNNVIVQQSTVLNVTVCNAAC